VVHWRDDPAVAEVLSHAQEHSDPEIRAMGSQPAA
jgi:hypothetical protein